MKNEVSTPQDYLNDLPENRRIEIKKVRSLIRKNLPKGYKELIKWGMITYEVPPKKDGKPSVSVSLGNQKNYMAMYFSNIHKNSKGEQKFKNLYQQDGNKLNMGKSCLRFKKANELNMNFLAELLSGSYTTPF